ncbi:MAG: ABC1 kinase family protein, partial [Myxococcota bacterium]
MSKRDALKGITTGFARRTLKTGRIAASVAAAGAKRVVRTSTDDDAHFGEALLSQMDEMKGFAMKAGQILSYMDGALPPETARRLRALQKGSKPVEFDVLRPAAEASLGGTIEDLFERFDITPIASASIGQVHRASLDGQELAVKVQYPNVASTFRSDFSTLRQLCRLASLGSNVNAPAIVRELETRFLEECDYVREAAWQEAVRAQLALPGAVIPAVRHDRSTGTVLSSAFMPGQDFYAFVQTASQAERNQAAAVLFQASFGLIFKHGIINADPHPGNY